MLSIRPVQGPAKDVCRLITIFRQWSADSLALSSRSFLAYFVPYFPNMCQLAGVRFVDFLSQRLFFCVSLTLNAMFSFGLESKKQLNLKRKNVMKTSMKLHEGKRWKE